MRNTKFSGIITLSFLAFFLFSYKSETLQLKGEINILFIGNGMTSYNNMPQILQKMLDEEKQKYVVQQSTYFGLSLEKHFSVYAEQNGEGTHIESLGPNEKSSTEKLLSKDWDYVVLQDYKLPSPIPGNGTVNIVPTIQKIQQKYKSNVSEFVLFKVWPNLDPYPKDFSYIKTVNTLDEEVDLINLTYDSIAKETHISTLPITNCYMSIMKKGNMNLHDGRYYPSEYGAYLNACIFYKYFTKKNAIEIKYTANLDSVSVQAIQKVVDTIYP